MIEVKPDDAEQRLDRWLRRVFPQLTQGRLKDVPKGATPRGWRAGEIGNTPDRGTDDSRPPIPTKDAAFDYDPHAPRTRPLKQAILVKSAPVLPYRCCALCWPYFWLLL